MRKSNDYASRFIPAMPRILRTSLLLALLIALSISGVVLAHADIVRSDPAANAVLEQAPAQITIEFTEPVEPRLSKIEVLYADGSSADNNDTWRDPNDPRVLHVSLQESREGTYIVSWRALSEVDGHVTSGSYVFSVGQPIDPAKLSAQGSGAVTSPLDMLARALTFIGQGVIAGVVAFRWLVWRPALKAAQLSDEVDARSVPLTKRVLIVALACAGAGAILMLSAQSGNSGGSIGDWLGTRVGRVWLGRAATLIAIGVLIDDIAATARGQRFGAIVSIWLPLQLLFLTTLTSHSAAITQPPIVPFIIDFIHLIATSIWVGGLAMLAFVVPRVARTLGDEDRSWMWLRTVVNFSTLAAVAVGALLVTGSYLSFLHVGSWTALIGTAYGRVLLLKVALVGVVMLIGGYNLLVIKPQLDRAIDHPEAGPQLQHRFRRTVLIEATVGVLVLASAGILTALPRSKDPQPAVAAGPLQLTTRSDDLDVTLTIDPARSGASMYSVRLSQNGQPVADAQEVALRFTYLTRGLGSAEAQTTAADDGAYTANGAYLSLPGEWQISTAVRRPDAFDVFADYRVRVNLDGQLEPLGQEGPIDALLKWLSIYGMVFGGILAVAIGAAWLFIAWKAADHPAALAVLIIPAIIAIPIGVYSIVTFTREATPGLTLTNPFLPDETSLQIGRELFNTNCMACHGERGRGDGLAAASLSIKPPDYGSGHLDIHTDGDIFYWIQNGVSQGSPMPAFKDKLTDDEIWHVVNYVRRLRNEAAGAGPAQGVEASPTPTVVLQPYTPPSFVAPEVPTSITPTPSASGDPIALEWLATADAAMNALQSLIEDQTVRDTAGNQLRVRFEFNAPDRLRYAIENGPTSVQIGSNDYQQRPDGTWFANRRGIPFVWPQYAYASVAEQARVSDEGSAKVVAFTWNGFDFKVWIDPQTARITRYSLTDGARTVDGAYRAFNAAPAVEAPQ
jgi:copper transport protein